MIPDLPYKNLKGSPNKNTQHSRTKGPVIPLVGSLYRSSGPLPGVPSYHKITMKTVISDPDNYEINHSVEIKDHKVYFNGYEIVRAPEPFAGKLKGKSQWTPARRLTFCKAVVWAIDPGYQGYVIKRVKNTSGQMEDQSFPDDLYFRELIALYPALIDSQSQEMQQIMRDEHPERYPEVVAVIAPGAPLLTSPMELSKEDFDKCFKLVNPVKSGEIDPCPVLTMEEMTGYPNTQKILNGKTFKLKIPVEIEELCEMEYRTEKNDEYDNYYSSVDLAKADISEMFEILNPVIVHNPAAVIHSWTRGSMVITEEVRASC